MRTDLRPVPHLRRRYLAGAGLWVVGALMELYTIALATPVSFMWWFGTGSWLQAVGLVVATRATCGWFKQGRNLRLDGPGDTPTHPSLYRLLYWSDYFVFCTGVMGLLIILTGPLAGGHNLRVVSGSIMLVTAIATTICIRTGMEHIRRRAPSGH
jgi:hypothetical protein